MKFSVSKPQTTATPSSKVGNDRRSRGRGRNRSIDKPETYSINVLMKSITDAFMEKYNYMIETKVGSKAFHKKFCNMNKINLTHFILTNFNNYINEKNKFNLVRYVNRFKNAFVATCWDTKVLLMGEVCSELIDEIIHYTGINMLVEFPNETPNISCTDVYNMVNDETPVVYCYEITPRLFCVMTIDNKKTNEVCELYNSRYVNVEDQEYYAVKCSYIEPIVNCRTHKFSWKDNKNIDCVTIPFKTPHTVEVKDICYMSRDELEHCDVRVSI